MANRFGDVLYWAACIAALAWLALVSAGAMQSHLMGMFWFMGVIPSAIIWGIGRAARYVLSGG